MDPDLCHRLEGGRPGRLKACRTGHRRVVRLGGFAASEPSFTDQPPVANGASELLPDSFGEIGRHARAAVGSVALPLGATVEVEMIARVE